MGLTRLTNKIKQLLKENKFKQIPINLNKL